MDKPKLPLRVADQSGDIVDAGDFFVCTPKSKHAQFIVQACNSYEMLVSALAECADTMEKLRADLTEVDAALHAQRIAVLELGIAEARAALSQAREGGE